MAVRINVLVSNHKVKFYQFQSTRNTDCTKITLRKQGHSPQIYRRIRDNGIKPVVPPPKKTPSYEEFVRTVQIRRLESRDRRLKDFQSRKKQAQERKKLENELKRKQFLANRERQLRDDAERLLELERKRKDNRRYWEEHPRRISRVEKSLGGRNVSPRFTDMNGDMMKDKNMAMISTSTISLYGIERHNGYGMDYCDPYKFKIYLPPPKLPKTKRERAKRQPYYGDSPLPNVFKKYSMRKIVNKATFPASYAHSAQPPTFKRTPKAQVFLPEASSDFTNNSYDGPTAVSMMKEAAKTKRDFTQKASKKLPSYKIPNSKTHLTKKPSSNRNRKPTPKIDSEKSRPNHSTRCHCGQMIASPKTSLSSILSLSDTSSAEYICAKVRLRNKCQPMESLPTKSPRNFVSPDRPDPFQRNICKSQSDVELTSSSSDSITKSLCSTVTKSSKTSCFRKTSERQQSEDAIQVDTVNTLITQKNNHIIVTSKHTESIQSQDEQFSDTFLCEEKTYEQMISENNDTVDYNNTYLNELAQASMEVYVTSASCLTPQSAINSTTSEAIGVNVVNDVQYVIIPNDPISLPYDLSPFVYFNPVVTPIYEATGEDSGLISCVPTESCLHVRHVVCTPKYEEDFLPKINGTFFPTMNSFGLNSFQNEFQVIITPNTNTEVFNYTTNMMGESENTTEEILNMPRTTPNSNGPNPNTEIFSGPNNTGNSDSYENVGYSIVTYVTVEDEGSAVQGQNTPITTNLLQPILEQEKEPDPEPELEPEPERDLEPRTKSGVELQPEPKRCCLCCSAPSNDTSIIQNLDLRSQLECDSNGTTTRKAGYIDTNILKAVTSHLEVSRKAGLNEKLDKEIEENLSDLSTDSSTKIIVRSNCGFAVIYITKGKKKSKKKEIGTTTEEENTPEKTRQKRKEKCAENDESCLKRRYRLRAFRRSYKSEFQSRHSKIQFEDDGSFRDDVREILTPKASQDLVESRTNFRDQHPKEHDSEEYLPKDHHLKEHHPKCPNAHKPCQCRKKRRSSRSYRREGPSTMRSKKISNVVSSHISFLSRPHPSEPLTLAKPSSTRLTPYSIPSNLSPNDLPLGNDVSIVTLYRRTSEKLELHANSPYDSLNEIRKRYSHILTSSSSSSGAQKHSLDLLSPDSTSLIKTNIEPIKPSRKSKPSRIATKDTRTQTRGNRNTANPPSTSARRNNEGNNRVENSQPSGAPCIRTGEKCSRNPDHACEQDTHRHRCPGKTRARYRDLLNQDHQDDRLSGGACCLMIPVSLSRVLDRICYRSRKGRKRDHMHRDPSESDPDEDLETSKSRYRAGATPVPVYHHDQVQALIRSLAALNHFRKMVDLVADQVHLEDCDDLNIKYYVSCRIRCMVEELMSIKASYLRSLLDDLQTFEKENNETDHNEFEEHLQEFIEKIKSNKTSTNFNKIVPNISQEVQDTLDEILEEVREVLLSKLDELCNCGTYLEASSSSTVSEMEETSKAPAWIQQAVKSVIPSKADEEEHVELCPVDIILLSSLLAKHLVDEFLG